MAREVKNDFDLLKKFIKEYSLSSFEKDAILIEYLSQMHKKYYSLMAFIYELKDLKNPIIIDGKQRDFLLETVSDVGNSIFLSINGAYKPSRLMLRSSIETFSKGFVIDELTQIDQEKRIYQMFDNIKAISFFSDEPNKTILADLNSLYSDLSKDIHTADKENMQHTSSLNYFPTKSKSSLESICKINSKIISSFLTLLCQKYNKEFHTIHHTNKQIIIDNIPKKYRKIIMNIE
jgi:hypothetical protein